MNSRVSAWCLLLCLMALGVVLIWFDNPLISFDDQASRMKWTIGWLIGCLAFVLVDGLNVVALAKLASLRLMARNQANTSVKASRFRKGGVDTQATLDTWPDALTLTLNHQYGRLWRRQVKILLVTGEPEQIEAIAPTLAAKHWLEGEGVVLLHGGSLQAETTPTQLGHWCRLCPSRPVDGVVWALTAEQSQAAEHMDSGVRHLRTLYRALRWQAPLHLWQVCQSPGPQAGRPNRPAGLCLAPGVTPEQLQVQLAALAPRLTAAAVEQLRSNPGYDFFLALSEHVKQEGGVHWREVLAPLMPSLARGVWLRGLWFSLPLRRAEGSLPHVWLPDPAWQGILDDPAAGRWQGWPPQRIGYIATLATAAMLAAGLLLSFALNHYEISRVRELLVRTERPATGTDMAALRALDELSVDVARLTTRGEAGALWYLGLSRNAALLEALLPRYAERAAQLLRDPLVARLEQQLATLGELPAGDLAREAQAKAGYQALRAYLMLARPQRLEGAALTPLLPRGIAYTSLWAFYLERWPQQPEWHIKEQPALVARARQVLLSELGHRNADQGLYQQVLASVANDYPPLTLAQMAGDTAAGALFDSADGVPGVFTRQAWEGRVREAIDAQAEARREQVDWVLSDQPAALAPSVSPAALKHRLTQRYFQDYSHAWMGFLNRLRWQPSRGLDQAIEQLALASDASQSPLVALLGTLAWQGEAGQSALGLGDNLLASAQKLIGNTPLGNVELPITATPSPLAGTFGPWLALQGKADDPNSSRDLTLAAYLNRLTAVRLKLEHVSRAEDPQATALSLAQSVFQGRGVEFTEPQAYGQLLAASLGAQWHGAGQALFVQPLEQAWQRLLQPSARSLNSQWRQAIVEPWNSAFVGRYPFAAGTTDASLALLGQMVRRDNGRIDRFLREELAGVLRKQGNRWVPANAQGQGLRVNPAFLEAVNQLGELADVLFTDGAVGLGFELSGKPVRDLVQTTFTLDGNTHHYFNQKERWQRFTWPGHGDRPGVSLTWTSVYTGERLYGDYAGNWGLIRLLEQANATPMDHDPGHYRLVITAPDGIGLTWHLRTELGEGPLALLKLRGFSLPEQVFLEPGQRALAMTEGGER